MSNEERPPEGPEGPAGDQPTVGWTPPEQPKPAWTPPPEGAPATPPEQPGPAWTSPPPDAPPPPPPAQADGEPAPPYASGQGPLLSSAPTTAASSGWTAPANDRREIAPGLVFSGTAARFVAFWIDGIILALVGGVITSTVGSGAPFNPSGQLVWTTRDWVASILNVAINGAYFVGFWSGGRRATLGQMLLKIQVGNAFDGRPLSLEQAVRRWLGLGQFFGALAVSAAAVGLVGVLSLIWTVVLLFSTVSSPTKQGLHDRFANSAVVRPANAGNGLVYACLIIVIVLPILALLALISLIFIGGQVSTILSPAGSPA